MSRMKPSEFKAWREWMGLSQTKAAEFLGVSNRTISLWEIGHRYEDKRPVHIPKTVSLSCAALAQGIRDYSGPSSS